LVLIVILFRQHKNYTKHHTKTAERCWSSRSRVEIQDGNDVGIDVNTMPRDSVGRLQLVVVSVYGWDFGLKAFSDTDLRYNFLELAALLQR